MTDIEVLVRLENLIGRTDLDKADKFAISAVRQLLIRKRRMKEELLEYVKALATELHKL